MPATRPPNKHRLTFETFVVGFATTPATALSHNLVGAVMRSLFQYPTSFSSITCVNDNTRVKGRQVYTLPDYGTDRPTRPMRLRKHTRHNSIRPTGPNARRVHTTPHRQRLLQLFPDQAQHRNDQPHLRALINLSFSSPCPVLSHSEGSGDWKDCPRRDSLSLVRRMGRGTVIDWPHRSTS